jgi:hypothetical protein
MSNFYVDFTRTFGIFFTAKAEHIKNIYDSMIDVTICPNPHLVYKILLFHMYICSIETPPNK